MSLPKFDTQGSLFESLGSIAADLFDQKDKYKLFARKVWPLLAGCREELAQRRGECELDGGKGVPGFEPSYFGLAESVKFLQVRGAECGRAPRDRLKE